MHDPSEDRYVANTFDFGVISAVRLPQIYLGTNLVNKAIIPVGNVFFTMENFIKSQDIQALDIDSIVSRLFDSAYINGRFGNDRRLDMVDELSRDIYEELNPIGQRDIVLMHNLNRALLCASAELTCHLEKAGAYIEHTLIYDYAKRIGKKHALLSKKQHAVFI